MITEFVFELFVRGRVDEFDEPNEIRPIVRFVHLEFVGIAVVRGVRTFVDEAGFVAAWPEIGSGLEQHAVVVADAAVEELVVNLFHDRVKAPRFAVVAHFRKRGPRRQYASVFTQVQEDLFPGERRVLEAVVEIELLEQIIGLARNEAVEVHLERLFVAGVVHA